ncbi:Hint domain-containing protein [Tropicimonas sp. TH_r6]|uniref:Hint domain-containing protein n=1 Tax=Tropicimonas sp. TH_r6 TaxID=3082085 RepID=UPI002954E384|nr:Hint domain-containing protein [Tropicimonas sp. TH_r6]MDV7142244.1 Hint domain-containing protein [Tropicimonas sp. TH_r6]
MPLFEDAFAAFARGTLIATPTGPTAIEDLLPGDSVQTANGPDRLLWLGNMELSLPRESLATEQPRLTRIAADSFGLGRPMPDLLLGPRARILMRSPRCREMLGATEAFAPADGFIDGVSVIELKPVASMSLYQLGFAGQQTVFANGIEAESFHPGLRLGSMLECETLAQFLDLFPHIDGPDGFGPMPIPRLTSFELERLRDGL